MSLKVVLGENSSKLILPDGNEYFLSPLTLGDIASAEQEFGCDLESFDLAIKKLKNVLFLVYLSLKRRNPDVKVEMVGDMFSLKDMKELQTLIESIFNISGLLDASGKTEKNG